MKNSTKEIILNGVFSSLIPAVCSYLGTSDNILCILQEKGYLGEKLDLHLFAECMNIVAVFSTFFLLTLPLIIRGIRQNSLQKQRDALLKHYKDIFETTLKNELQLKSCHINVRIFVPKITMLVNIRKKLNMNYKLMFCIENVNGLADSDITENLKFEVYPNRQGLVGECYEKRAIIYDDDLEHNNEVSYNLSNQQIAKTNRLKFSLACPLFSESGEIVAIIALDSCDEIKIKRESQDLLRKHVLNYTQSLYECIPELFKAKGGML